MNTKVFSIEFDYDENGCRMIYDEVKKPRSWISRMMRERPFFRAEFKKRGSAEVDDYGMYLVELSSEHVGRNLLWCDHKASELHGKTPEEVPLGFYDKFPW